MWAVVKKQICKGSGGMLSGKILEILDCLGVGLHFARLNGGEREKERECRAVKRKSQSPVLDLAQNNGCMHG